MSWNAYIETYFTKRQGIENMVSAAGIFSKQGAKCAATGPEPTIPEVQLIGKCFDNEKEDPIFINGVKYYIIYKSLQPKIGRGEEKLYLKKEGGGAVIQCTQTLVIYACWDSKIKGKYGGQQRNQNHPDTARLVEDCANILNKSGM